MSDFHEPVLDYFHADSDEFDDRHGDTAAALSLACAVVPIAGMLLGNPPMLLLGFSLVAWLGILFGLAACISGCRNEAFRVVAWIALSLNLIFGGLGAWVMMRGGIC